MAENNRPWDPLPSEKWDRSAARHLASRWGFSIHPNFVKEIESLGPLNTITATLQPTREFEEPESIVSMQASQRAYREEFRELEGNERFALRQKRQQRERASYTDYALEWYAFARKSTNTPQEKLVSFFQNVWVVTFQKVKQPQELFDHQNRIRTGLRASYPVLCKALARSPAMIRFLDLNRNKAGRPNENFARELFELFILGEGNYTEQDIKEAARALTGYTVNGEGVVRRAPRQVDDGIKTVFGQKGNFDLDGIIDLAFEQPAAARFLPQELARYYLTPAGLPDELLEPLAEGWRKADFSLPWLYTTFFSSNVFYAPEYRGNMIKSPEHFAIGLWQDLALDVIPSPRRSFNPLRQMGQPFYNPPNVRGWVGDRRWINSATLSARRQFVATTLARLNRENLNADELRALEAAEAEGAKRFEIDYPSVAKWLGTDPRKAADKLAENLFIDGDASLLRELLAAVPDEADRPQRRAAQWLEIALNTPNYHLC